MTDKEKLDILIEVLEYIFQNESAPDFIRDLAEETLEKIGE